MWFLRTFCLLWCAAILPAVSANADLRRSVPNVAQPEVAPSQSDNMNGEYVISTTPGGKAGLFPKQYKDYPGGAEYYDVYSPPITTLYSQVWWKPLEPIPMPEEMVKKYAGSGMAILGWEIDQVRRTPDGDVSVPISATYNHHYTSQLIGAGSRFRKIMLDGPDDPRAANLTACSGHGLLNWDQPQYIAEQVEETVLPSKQVFSSANGGEYRKSLHGFSPGYAIVIDSPTAFQITPMQIDTWNREAMNISGPLPPPFVPGPLPHAAQSPKNPLYSGLLECPMTTRITKEIDGSYVAQSKGACAEAILTFQECFHAAATTLSSGGHHSFVNETGSDPNRPPGCSANVDSSSALTIHVFFNKLSTSTTGCASGAATVTGATSSLVHVSVSLNAPKRLAEITMQGPATVWFGVGFGAAAMLDMPWTVVIEGDGNVSEYKLGNHDGGMLLKPSVKVVSNTVESNVRKVVLSRPLQGADKNYYTFNMTSGDATILFVNAIGNGAQYAYHKLRDPSSITLLPDSKAAGTCVCPEKPKAFGQATGSLVYNRVANQSYDTGTGAVGFRPQKCKAWPATELNEQLNPTCDIRHYRGGQWACHHMWSLLDADQEIPWADTPLVLHHKYRFWVQPYNKTYHQPLHYGFGTELLIGSPYEYDVPKCKEGVVGCALVGGTWIHTITGNTLGKYKFSALNFHCHAPTCLSMAVYACAKGTALADCNATIGKLICRQEPIYGGTGHPAINGTRFDEPGYIAIPDCFWGSAEFGLEEPPDLTGVPLHMVKTANATWGHYGEMSGGQPWVFNPSSGSGASHHGEDMFI